MCVCVCDTWWVSWDKEKGRKERGEVFEKTKCMLLLQRNFFLDNMNMQTWCRGLKKISGVQFPSLTPCSAEY